MDDHNLSNPALRAACRQAVLEVLETMFFEVPLDEDVPSPVHEPEALIARARLAGSLEGWRCTAPQHSFHPRCQHSADRAGAAAGPDA